MAKITLANILSGFSLTGINANFKKVEDALNNSVLFRDNPNGEDNTLKADIDMNGHKIYNLAAPAGDNHAARLKDVKNAIEGLSGQTANLIAFEPTNDISANNVQGAIEEVMARSQKVIHVEDYADNSADDTNALKAFFAAIAQGRKGEMTPRVYRYSLKNGGTLSVSCPVFILKASGATIQCIDYPSSGNSALVKLVDIDADYADVNGLRVDGGWAVVGNKVDNFCVNGNYFNYMHALSISARGGFLDNIYVYNVEGIGFTTETGRVFSNVQVGKITTHDCWMIGQDIRSTASTVQDSTFGQLLSYNCGTRGGGWVQVNFGDNKTSSGVKNLSVGLIHTYNGGGSGVGIGQYASTANGDWTGALSISVGTILTHGNKGHGAELYASTNINVNHIKAFDNLKRGVYFERSDTNDIFGYVGILGSISSSFNGEDGVLISGWRNLQIGSITSWDNGVTSTTASGVYFYAGDFGSLTETGNIQIGSIRSFDDRNAGSRTQAYGIAFSYFGQPDAYTHIGSADLSNNKTYDLAWLTTGKNAPVSFGDVRYDSLYPSFADNKRILFKEGKVFKQRWRTTDASTATPLIALPTAQDCVVEMTAVGRSSDGTTYHMAKDTCAFRYTGSGFQKLSNMNLLVAKSGASDSYINNFGTAIGAFVTGVPGVTIDWEVTLTFSTGTNYGFAI